MVRRQGGAPGRAGVLPHGRFLRAVLRRRRSRRRRARHRADPARRTQRQSSADVRRAAARGRGLSRPADPPRLPRGGGASRWRTRSPAPGKAPIRREVVRLVTPGTITEETLLEAGRANLLLALAPDSQTASAPPGSMSRPACSKPMTLAQAELASLLGRLEPAEILAPPTAADRRVGKQARARCRAVAAAGGAAAAGRDLQALPASTLSAASAMPRRSRRVMAVDYVRATQAGTLPRLAHPTPRGGAGLLSMDAATRASLEIHRARDGGTLHTLLGAVQRTLSAAGARMLAGWLAAPLTDTAAIAARQDAWSWLHRRSRGRRAVARRPARHARYCARARTAVGEPRRAARPRSPCAMASRAAPGCARRRSGRSACPSALHGEPQSPRLRDRSRRWSSCSPTRWPILRRTGWTTATRSAPASMPNSMPNAPCATTAAGCSRRCSSITRSATRSPA